jgi:hypothetical protein
MSSRARALFAAAVCAALVWEARTLFVPFATLRANGKQTYEIQEFAAGAPVGQTFRARTDGLESATLRFVAERPFTLNVRYRLLGWSITSVPDHWVPIVEGTEAVPLPKGESAHTFRFKAVTDSHGQVYQFQAQEEDEQPGGSAARARVTLLASQDDALDEGNLIVDKDQLVDRDLIFAAAGADSRFDDFRMRISPQLPRSLRDPGGQWAIALVLFTLYNWAFAVFAYQLLLSAAEEHA